VSAAAGWILVAACAVWPGALRAADSSNTGLPASAAPAADQAAASGTGEAAPAPRAAWPEADTVLDLLRADAQAAAAQLRLGRAQDWLARPGGASAPPVTVPPRSAGGPADRLDVVAIYGVGRALQADVSVNGAVWRYRQGRHWPLGVVSAQPAEPGYALVAIDLPCVRLRRDDDIRTACLPAPETRHD